MSDTRSSHDNVQTYRISLVAGAGRVAVAAAVAPLAEQLIPQRGELQHLVAKPK